MATPKAERDAHCIKEYSPIGRAFLDPEQYLLPFELSSMLLLAALVGAAYLARRRRT